MKVLLSATGSVAAIKYWKLFNALEKDNHETLGILTEKGDYFARRGTGIKCIENIITEEEEWSWDEVGDPVQHIELRDWCDILVIAPLSANTLAKMYNGFCDNLLTSVYRAWDFKKPIIIAPAMNTQMWNNSITSKQLEEIKYRHNYLCKVVEPVSKKLACGVNDMGAMASIDDIINAVNSFDGFKKVF